MKKIILFCLGGIAIFSIGFFIWVRYKLNKYEGDNNKSTELVSEIQQCFHRQPLASYPFEEGIPSWGNDYLVLENMSATDEISVRYHSDWNEKLGTESNFPGENVRGLAIIEIDYIEVGEYVSKKGGIKSGKAIQRNYIINYFDMKKRAIIAKDTLIGDEPSETKGATGSGMGDLPKDKLVVEAIKNRIK